MEDSLIGGVGHLGRSSAVRRADLSISFTKKVSCAETPTFVREATSRTCADTAVCEYGRMRVNML